MSVPIPAVKTRAAKTSILDRRTALVSPDNTVSPPFLLEGSLPDWLSSPDDDARSGDEERSD
jgi:hypothetical protein